MKTNKSIIKSVGELSHLNKVIITFEKDRSFLDNYQKILNDIGFDVNSPKLPPIKTDLEEGLDTYFAKNYDIEIIYFSSFIAMVIRYNALEDKVKFMGSLLKYAELRKKEIRNDISKPKT